MVNSKEDIIHHILGVRKMNTEDLKKEAYSGLYDDE
jgi:hypothetical protein